MQTTIKTLSYKVYMTDGSGIMSIDDEGATPETACQFLEKGGVIVFPEGTLSLPQADREFLLGQKQAEAGYFKNIAYRPAEDRVSGFKYSEQQDYERLRSVMSNFNKQVTVLLRTFLAPYAKNWQPDFATFRSIEEQGRKMRLRARNDLLHVDSFPTRPIYGDRILRTFLNVNPRQSRIWNTSHTFEQLLKMFRDHVSPPHSFMRHEKPKSNLWQEIAQKLGLKLSGRSSYDDFMLRFHNFLKENSNFQQNTKKDRWEFAPGAVWIVFTDMVSHAVLSGQFALEQTFIISQKDLLLPQKAPINLIKKTYGLS